jgi:hypothetical protein
MNTQLNVLWTLRKKVFWTSSRRCSEHTIMSYSSIVFKSFKIGSDRVSDRLISGHLGFLVVWVPVGSDFESSNFGLPRVSGHSGSSRVKFQVVWSRVISGFGSSGFGSGRFISDFGSSGFGSGRVMSCLGHFNLGLSQISGHFESDRVRLSQFNFFLKIGSGSSPDGLDRFFKWCQILPPLIWTKMWYEHSGECAMNTQKKVFWTSSRRCSEHTIMSYEHHTKCAMNMLLKNLWTPSKKYDEHLAEDTMNTPHNVLWTPRIMMLWRYSKRD